MWAGEFKTITVRRAAVLGPAAQAQRLDFAAAWYEGRREPVHLKSVEHVQTLKCKKEQRETARTEVKDAIASFKKLKTEQQTT